MESYLVTRVLKKSAKPASLALHVVQMKPSSVAWPLPNLPPQAPPSWTSPMGTCALGTGHPRPDVIPDAGGGGTCTIIVSITGHSDVAVTPLQELGPAGG